MTLTIRRLNYQLRPSQEPLKPSVHIWMERLRAKYERPHLKNEREKLRERLRSSHYIGEIVKVGFGCRCQNGQLECVSNQPKVGSNVVTT